jgi:hypothetical protein
MTNAESLESAVAPREVGWRGPLLGLVLVLLLPSFPPFLLLFPVQLLLPVDRAQVLLAPALAAAALVGWKFGGRFALAGLWTAAAVWILWLPGDGSDAFTMLLRGWGVLLAACFSAVQLSGWGARFLDRALLAIACAVVLGTLTLAVGGGIADAKLVFENELVRRADLAQATWSSFTAQPQWQKVVGEQASAVELTKLIERQFVVLPQLSRLLAPALLVVQSLVVLALTWAIYHRFGRARLGPPLAPLRDLRFHDAFVWGVIAGLLAIVLKAEGVWWFLGMNALAVSFVLYALRGIGVLLWFLSPGRWSLVMWTIVLVLFLNIVGVMAFVIGLGDTWLDWRRRARPKTQSSE